MLAVDYNKQKNHFEHCFCSTYASCIEYVRKHGILAKMPISITTTLNHPCNTSKNSLKVLKDNAIRIKPPELTKPTISVSKQESVHHSENADSKDSKKLNDKQLTEKEGLHGRGLFHYKKWWERNEVNVSVNGDMLTGVPIFTDKNTLRVINDDYSYFIPLEKVDYIRTSDGLKKSRSDYMTTK